MGQYRFPTLTAGSVEGQLRQLNSYLRQLVEQMNLEREEGQKAGQIDPGTDPAPICRYPVGAVYLTVSQISPNRLFGGRWEQLEGILPAQINVWKRTG